MAVRRITVNIAVDDPDRASKFYSRLFGLERAMDMGFIVNLAGEGAQTPQMQLLSEGGSGTPVPALSIEVDDVDATHAQAVKQGVAIEYGPVDEPWGVRRFFMRDAVGTLVNILSHMPAES